MAAGTRAWLRDRAPIADSTQWHTGVLRAAYSEDRGGAAALGILEEGGNKAATLVNRRRLVAMRGSKIN